MNVNPDNLNEADISLFHDSVEPKPKLSNQSTFNFVNPQTLTPLMQPRRRFGSQAPGQPDTFYGYMQTPLTRYLGGD